MAQQAAQKAVNPIHYVIVVALSFGFAYLPPFAALTPYGMGILGSFLGAIWGWLTIGMLWPSLLRRHLAGYLPVPRNRLHHSAGVLHHVPQHPPEPNGLHGLHDLHELAHERRLRASGPLRHPRRCKAA